MTRVVRYGGERQVGERVLTPDGPGHVDALYPDTPYYEGRTVQVTLEGEYDEEGYADLDYVRRYRDAEWDGYPSRLELLAATVYNARAQSPREMTPERWALVKQRFGASSRQRIEQAREELEDL